MREVRCVVKKAFVDAAKGSCPPKKRVTLPVATARKYAQHGVVELLEDLPPLELETAEAPAPPENRAERTGTPAAREEESQVELEPASNAESSPEAATEKDQAVQEPDAEPDADPEPLPDWPHKMDPAEYLKRYPDAADARLARRHLGLE